MYNLEKLTLKPTMDPNEFELYIDSTQIGTVDIRPEFLISIDCSYEQYLMEVAKLIEEKRRELGLTYLPSIVKLYIDEGKVMFKERPKGAPISLFKS